jgi:hypothetical protein
MRRRFYQHDALDEAGYYTFTASVAVGGMSIVVSRSYNSLDADLQGEFGCGWKLDLSNTKIEVTHPEGSGLSSFEGNYTPFRDGGGQRRCHAPAYRARIAAGIHVQTGQAETVEQTAFWCARRSAKGERDAIDFFAARICSATFRRNLHGKLLSLPPEGGTTNSE